MSVKYFTKLTEDLVERYGNRKQAGYISFFYDVDEKAFTPVPVDVEHAALASKFLNVPEEQLQYSPRAKKLIPIIIELGYNEHLELVVKGLLTGVCGMEIGYKVRHNSYDLKWAHWKAYRFIKKGNIALDKDFKRTRIDKYRE